MKTPAELALALMGTALQLGVLVVFLYRRYYERFPAFLGCIAVSVLGTVFTLAVRNKPLAYLWGFWAIEALYVCLAFLALLEVVKSVFRNFYHLSWFRFLFPTIGILMVCTAVIRSLAKPPAQVSRAFAIIIFLELAVRFLQIGIFFLFFALVRFFHMHWRRHEFGIVLGFAISAAGNLAAFLLRSEFGTKMNYFVRMTPPIAYTLAVVVWLLTFLIPPPDNRLLSQSPGLTPEEMLAEVRQYRSSVKKILKR
ncbi:MAG: hypothetical protein ACM3SW_08200 [Actinomycetota bacterium]